MTFDLTQRSTAPIGRIQTRLHDVRCADAEYRVRLLEATPHETHPAMTTNASQASAHPAEPAALIDHILTRFHEVHRRQLPELIRQAARVEAVHAEHGAAPRGLAALLTSMHTELLQHMEKEESILFPMLKRGGTHFVVHPIGVMRTEHEAHAARLQHVMALTRNATPPADACTTWRQLCADVRQFANDLQQHIRLENEVLFPQFEVRRG